MWAHVKVRDCSLTLVQQLRLLEEDASSGTRNWQVLQEFEFIETSAIRDVTIWCELESGVIRTLVPRDVQ